MHIWNSVLIYDSWFSKRLDWELGTSIINCIFWHIWNGNTYIIFKIACWTNLKVSIQFTCSNGLIEIICRLENLRMMKKPRVSFHFHREQHFYVFCTKLKDNLWDMFWHFNILANFSGIIQRSNASIKFSLYWTSSYLTDEHDFTLQFVIV